MNALHGRGSGRVLVLFAVLLLGLARLVNYTKFGTLTSNKVTGYYKILRSISVESDGVLKLDGVIITNEPAGGGGGGGGVEVNRDGRLVMYTGEISGNAITGSLDPFVHAYGGGVRNFGVFEMYGGKVSGNQALDGEGAGDIFIGNFVGYGGGVYNQGTFKMFGGEISGNNARYGGGVCNSGTFTMSGGTISDNTATQGGGVYNNRYSGTFEWINGVISDNTSTGDYDDNVYPPNGDNGTSDNNNCGSSNNNGSNNGNNNSSNGNYGNNDGFNVWIIVVIAAVVVVSVIVVGHMFVYFKNKVSQVETKFSTLSQDKVEV